MRKFDRVMRRSFASYAFSTLIGGCHSKLDVLLHVYCGGSAKFLGFVSATASVFGLPSSGVCLFILVLFI